MPPVRTHKRSNSFSGNGNGTNGRIALPLQTKSKRCISFYENPEQVKADQEEEDAAIERATRAYELEAAKSRLLDEKDLRDFARGVFRREYRAQKLDRWRKQVNLAKRTTDWVGDGSIGREGSRSRSLSPAEMDMTPEIEEERAEDEEEEEIDENMMDTDDDETPKPGVEVAQGSHGKSKTHYRQRSYNFSTTTNHERAKVAQHSPIAARGIVDLVSIPHAIQRKLIKAMNNICLISAFNFTKKYSLPLTLNIDSPSKTTRLTIHALTDAIIAAYNNGTIPSESVWEDIAFGFVGVFEAASVLDDAVLYFKMRLSDRRICAVLLSGVDLLQALRDLEGVIKGEAILSKTETLIERAKERALREDDDGIECGNWLLGVHGDNEEQHDEQEEGKRNGVPSVVVEKKEAKVVNRELLGHCHDGEGNMERNGDMEMGCVESDEDR